MTTYQSTITTNSKFRLDTTKRNILLIGKAETNNKQGLILNPLSMSSAKALYGDSDLYHAYEAARNITKDSNVFTVNCQLITDYISLIDDIVHYNFDFIVPLDIYVRDTFVDPGNNLRQYFLSYYLELLESKENNATIIATDRHSSLYESMDVFIRDSKKVLNKFISDNSLVLSRVGNNFVYVLNNIKECKYANVLIAASLASYDFKSYPTDIKYKTYYDIDSFDLNDKNICFYKYHDASNESSIEQLNNLRPVKDIYKKVLIDVLIKYVVKRLDLSEYNGTLYTPYTILKIEKSVKQILDNLSGEVFKDYTINKIYYNKITINSGDIIVDVSIVPYGLLEKINICIEV
jgi:hypothetical protein